MQRRLLLLASLLLALGSRLAVAQIDPDPDDIQATPPNHSLCGTMALMQEMSGARDPKLPSLFALVCTDRAEKQHNVLTAGKHFRIHYDTSGRDSVSIADRNGNGIPDYIDTTAAFLEGSWDLEINQYKFDAPPSDNRGIGPEIDVYICDLAGDYYGFAWPETDDPTGPITVAGFLVLDNDFRQADGYPTTGTAGLKVTCAHEFHHIIQFSRYRYDFSQAAFYEATSVWFERQYAPEVNDYLQYVQPFLQAPQQTGFSTHNTGERGSVTGYCHVLYWDYLAKRVDRDVVRRCWELFKTEPVCFNAIDQVLRDSSLNLENSYCEFAEWCYHTGARTDDDKYFKEAATYKTMLPAQIKKFTGDDLLIQDYLYPLSFGLYQVAIPGKTANERDTVDFLVTNARTNFGKGGLNIPKDTFALDVSATDQGDYKPLAHAGDTIYFRLRSTDTQICVNPLFGGHAIIFPGTHVSPQPFLSDGAAKLLFGVDMDAEHVTSAKLYIYSSSLTRVNLVEQTGLLALDNQLGVIWDGRDAHGDLVPTGVYIYQLSINDLEPVLGKIAVVRR